MVMANAVRDGDHPSEAKVILDSGEADEFERPHFCSFGHKLTSYPNDPAHRTSILKLGLN